MHLPRIEAIYEDKNLARGLNKANYIRLVGAASWLLKQFMELQVPGEYSIGKLYHKEISRETLNVVSAKVEEWGQHIRHHYG